MPLHPNRLRNEADWIKYSSLVFAMQTMQILRYKQKL